MQMVRLFTLLSDHYTITHKWQTPLVQSGPSIAPAYKGIHMYLNTEGEWAEDLA